MSEVYIICEGFHDRAFWKGLLLSLGCRDAGLKPDGSRKPVYDPWSLEVKGGPYGFHSQSGRFVRVVPAGSRSNILPFARKRLTERDQKVLSHLIINCDCDEHADGTKSAQNELQFATVMELMKEFDQGAVQTGECTISIDAGATIVHAFSWRANDAVASGLPNQQTLERLISAAVVASHPARADCVERWLRSRPEPPRGNPKEYAWSYLAGWYAEKGSYEAFCEMLWQDAEIREHLKARLEGRGYWQVIANAVA